MEYPEFVTMLAKPLPTQEERIDHALIGLIGEVGELADAWKKHIIYSQEFDRANAVEEMGDLRFYFQMYLNEGFELRVLTEEGKASDTLPFFDHVCLLTKCVGDLCAPESVEDEQEDADYIENALWGFVYNFHKLAVILGVTEEEIIRLNMEKLTKRYPDKVFTEAHAAERLDKVGEHE